MNYNFFNHRHISIYLFFIFFFIIYLSNYIFLSELTNPTLFFHWYNQDQYLINYYEFGFVKRGLIGSLFQIDLTNYKYLTKMPMDSVTQENVDHIIKERDEAKNEYVVLQKTSVEDFWLRELETLETNYTVYKENRDKIQNNGKAKKAKGIKQKKIKI